MLDGRFAGNQRRMDHREEVEQRLAAAVARLSAGDLLGRLERAGLPYASAKSVQEVVDHPQLASRWTPSRPGTEDRRAAAAGQARRLRPGARASSRPRPRHRGRAGRVRARPERPGPGVNPGEDADGGLRAARPDDAQPIAAVHVATWQDAYAGLLPDEFLAGLDVGEWAERWRGRLAAAAEGMFTLVFEADGQVRGFVSGGPSRDESPGGEVYAIYLDPGWQGRGAGRSLLAAATRLPGRRRLRRREPVGPGRQPLHARVLRVPGLALRRHPDALDPSGRQQRPRGPVCPDPRPDLARRDRPWMYQRAR